jgi:PIN domain nuclease of toxin-antitoxin system
MTNPQDREVVDSFTVLLKSTVVTVSLPSAPLDPVDRLLTRSLLEQAITTAHCAAMLRPVIGHMNFEYEAAMRGAKPPGNA